MDGNDGHRWDEDHVVALLTEVLDDPEVDREQDDEPAGISLEDVVAAGRAAYCWLDVVVTLRNVARHLGPAAGASTACEPGH